jgi:hypothetical protein
MGGWTKEEIRKKNLIAPCGLYCVACGVYNATRDENEKFKAVTGNLYGNFGVSIFPDGIYENLAK